MEVPKKQAAFLKQVMTVASPDKQLALREQIDGAEYHEYIENAYLVNPFFRLTEDESRHFRENDNPSGIHRLIAARDAASRSTAPKYAVFCMPKSGSSFVQTALQHALQIPFMSLTSFGTPGSSSYFGMNSREQEIDELALTKAILKSPRGFISQNHTRYSGYLALQMGTFGITPIITIRNILDCIVSFDDMMVAWRTETGENGWISDAQFSLPLDYVELDAAVRLDLLAKSLGVWLVGFFLSWKRCSRQNIVAPVFIKYEEDVLDAERLVEVLKTGIGMSDEQVERLVQYVQAPNPKRSRFNVGVRGRGAKAIPERTIETLADYARLFRDEISEDEIAYLIR